MADLRSLPRRLIHSRLISATSGLLTVLGAFIGLQQGISGLRFVNPQPGEMEASIQTLVNGLTIKFSSSIWGIGCSIIFNGLEKLIEGAAWSRIRPVQTRIDGLFSRYTPETALSRLQISSAESEQILRGLAVAIGDHMQQALAQVGQFTSQAIGEAMQPAVETLTIAAQQLTSDMSTGSAEGLAQGIEAAAKSLEQSLNAVGDRYDQQFMDLSTQLTGKTTRLLRFTVSVEGPRFLSARRLFSTSAAARAMVPPRCQINLPSFVYSSSASPRGARGSLSSVRTGRTKSSTFRIGFRRGSTRPD